MDLTKNDTLMHTMAHPRLETLHWPNRMILARSNGAVTQVSKPALANLTGLFLRTYAFETTHLLPHLSSLTRLTLKLDYSGLSIFPYLSRMTTLVKIKIRICDAFRFSPADLEALYPLKNLTHCIFVGNEDFSPPPHANTASLIQPPSRPCELHKLEVLFIELENIWHLQNQLLTIAQVARNLRHLVSGMSSTWRNDKLAFLLLEINAVAINRLNNNLIQADLFKT
ncbi:hypothetical protein KCU64_g85, partial [Aureobasidium melanogenum]